MSAAHGSESPALPLPVDRDEAVILEWTVHLLKRDPARAWLAAAAILAAAALGFILFRSALLAILGGVLVFSAAAEYLLPIRYRITSRRITASYGAARLEMDWKSVRRLLDGGNAIKLSPFKRASRLDGLRGIVIRFAPDGTPGDRAGVLALIHRQRKEAMEANA